MKILCIDFETNGDRQSAGFKPTEVGIGIWDVACDRIVKSAAFLVNSLGYDEKIDPWVSEHCKLSKETLNEHGIGVEAAVESLELWIKKADAFMGWNCWDFDKPLLEKIFLKEDKPAPSIPWIDLKHDGGFTTSLQYTGADLGFLNPFPHQALSDVFAMIEVARRSGQDMNRLKMLADSPYIEIKAVVSFEEKDKARDNGFRWDASRRIWVRQVRERLAMELEESLPFRIEGV